MVASRRTRHFASGASSQLLLNNEKKKSKYTNNVKRLCFSVVLPGIAIIGAVIFILFGDEAHVQTLVFKQIYGVLKDERALQLHERALATEKYQNCSVSFQPPPARQQADWRKAFWVPSFPASGSSSPSKKGDIVKQLIDDITGLNSKNYHMSVKGGKLSRCHGISETPACSQGHPYVPVDPNKQSENFQSSVIFAIRNIATAFPASFTDKHIAYHNGKGQPEESKWREVRDEYLVSSIQTWREMIRWWRESEQYQVALYLPFEWLLSPSKGPQLLVKLAQLYQNSGFEVAPPDDLPCIWYKAASKEWKRQDTLMEYIPGYMASQQDLLLEELSSQIQESLDDPVLVEILEEYRISVRHDLRVENRTNTP